MRPDGHLHPPWFDQPVKVALHKRFGWDYVSWCLAHNLTVAAALRKANREGWWDGAGYVKGCP